MTQGDIVILQTHMVKPAAVIIYPQRNVTLDIVWAGFCQQSVSAIKIRLALQHFDTRRITIDKSHVDFMMVRQRW